MCPTRKNELDPKQIPIGIVGVGLMGTSIAACLIAAGHSVKGFDRDSQRRTSAPKEVQKLLQELLDERFLDGEMSELMSRFEMVPRIEGLRESQLVIECIAEDLQIKQQVIEALESSIDKSAIIGSNTSAIPLTLIQHDLQFPERILGIHWCEPAHVTRFMEIIKGDQTDQKYIEKVEELSRLWGKEPTVLEKDIRGFIANRISYAMFREALYLLESGIATVEEIDRSLRNDIGYWMTFAGPFRYMDLMGVPAYEKVMRDLLPELCNSTEVPKPIKEIVGKGGKGISTGKGFYEYSEAEAKIWKQKFHEFNFEIHRLALKYPEDLATEAEKENKQ